MAVLTKRWTIGLVAGALLLGGGGGAGAVLLTREQRVAAVAARDFDLRADVPGSAVLGRAADVLPVTGDDAPAPDPVELGAVLDPLLSASALGDSVSFDVVDAVSGEHLLAQDSAELLVPASTAKLLTGAAALRALGPDTTLSTTAVRGSGDDVVLIGGGDVLLDEGEGDEDEVNGHAGLEELADQVAAALAEDGEGADGDGADVDLVLDDTLFTGPARAEGWSGSDVGNGFVAPVHAIGMDAGRVEDERYGRRSADPAMAAAKRFRDLLEDRDVEVGSVERGRAPDRDEVLGRVRSAPVGDLVEYALSESDNTVAEVLARLVAVRRGKPATFDGGTAAVLAEVDRLDVPIAGARLADGSGLADGSRLPAAALTAVLALAAGPDHPELRPVLSGLPIAAVSGTLEDRFGGKKDKAATGVVRAKTGTLNGVSSLAGTVVDADGRLLVFAVMADEVERTDGARKALDRLVATLAGCGCRG